MFFLLGKDSELEMLQHTMGIPRFGHVVEGELMCISQATYYCWWFRNPEKSVTFWLYIAPNSKFWGVHEGWRVAMAGHWERVTNSRVSRATQPCDGFEEAGWERLRYMCWRLKKKPADHLNVLTNFFTCIYGYILYLRYRHMNRRKSQDSPCQLVSRISEPSTVSTGSNSGMNKLWTFTQFCCG